MSTSPQPQDPSPRAHAKSGSERRRWPRACADLPIAISLDGALHPARLRDVSRAGVCFYLDRAVPLMTVLGVELEVSSAGRRRKLRGQGAVVRCAKLSPLVSHWEVAVFFHDLADSERALLDALVRSFPAAV